MTTSRPVGLTVLSLVLATQAAAQPTNDAHTVARLQRIKTSRP